MDKAAAGGGGGGRAGADGAGAGGAGAEAGGAGAGGVAADDYDPHAHRDTANLSNYLEALMNMIKSALGTGVMALPQAFARSGLAIAAVATVLACGVLTHCLRAAVLARYQACRRRRVPLLSYSDAVEECLLAGPKPARRFAVFAGRSVTALILLFQLGTACVYVVFMAETLRKLIDEERSVLVYMAALFLPLMLFNLIPSLKALAPFNMVANLMILVGLCIVMYFVFTSSVRSGPVRVFGSVFDFPLFFGTALFAFNSVGVVLQIENNMLRPRQFPSPCGVLNVSMMMVLALYLVIGLCGAVFCGDKCADSITLNLPKGPLPNVVNWLMCAAIFISYVLHCFLPMEFIWESLRQRWVRPDASKLRLRLYESATRIVICLFTFVLAAAVPRLGLIISLFGALCMSGLGICFPALMEACLVHGRGVRGLPLTKNVLLFLVGMLVLVLGTVTALKAIVVSFL